MTWPTSDVDTTKTDQGTDDPSQARTALADLIVKFNQARNHVSAFIQGVLAAASAPAARVALGTVGWNLVEPRSPSASSSESFTGLAPGTLYKLLYSLNIGGPTALSLRFNSDSGANYSHAQLGYLTSGAADNANGAGGTTIPTSGGSGNIVQGEIFFRTIPGDDTIVFVNINACEEGHLYVTSGKYDGTAALTSVQLIDSLDVMTGTILLYKLHQS